MVTQFPGGSDGKASAYKAGDLGSIPGSGRSPGEGNGYPLQCSCLENPMDGGAWWTTVHGVAKSRTRLSDFTTFTMPVSSTRVCVCVLVTQSCLTLCGPMDCSLPGSSDHGILQAKILEWVTIPFLRGSNSDILHGRQILYHLRHQGRSNQPILKEINKERKTQTYRIHITPRINPKKN